MLHVLWVRDAGGMLKALWVRRDRPVGQVVHLDDYRDVRQLGSSGQVLQHSDPCLVAEG